MGALLARVARALLPAWRFFDDIDAAPVLHVRRAAEDAWCTVELVPPRAASAWLFNPRGNLALAELSLLEQLADDVAQPEVRSAEDVEELTTYKLVACVARRWLDEHAHPGPDRSFQFRLTLASPHTTSGTLELLVSRVHEA